MEKPMDSDMNRYRAVAIFSDIENEKISDREKAAAIYLVATRPERMHEVKKEAMRKVILWLWHRNFLILKKQKPDL